jgi:hypothetical protein
MRQRVSGTRGAGGIRLDETLMQLRSEISAFLASWAALVVDERGAAGRVGSSPARMAGFLVDHLEWLLAHPAADDFLAELADVTERARAACGAPAAPQLALGECILPDCEATLSGGAGHGSSGAVVRCAAGHSWEPRHWLEVMAHLRRAR